MRTIELGVTITDAAVDEKQTTIFCAPVTRNPRCPDCGHDGSYRDTITRPLTDLPVAGYPLVLHVAVPRYRCTTAECGRTVFNQDLGQLAAPRASTTRRCARYVLRRLMVDRTTISAIAAELGVSWHTVSSIAMRAVEALVAAAGPERLSGVRVIGVDEHRWAPRRIGPEGFVTLIIDLTAVHDKTGPARLLDMVEGRSATALASWLAAQPAEFAQGIEVVAMDGFAGYKTAAAAVVPDAVTVMDPFHVVALAGAKLDLIRQRIQQQTLGRRGHTGDPLYGIRRIARTRTTLLSARQHHSLTGVLDADEHIAVKVAYVIYQKIIAAYADPNRRRGKQAMTSLIDSIRRGVPAGLEEIAQLGRTLWRRRHDILAFFDHHASNGPTEAINGRLEALRRNALGFRNLVHYRWRSLLHSGALHTLVNAL
ncbi:ISL3 family transposase [Mycobacterium noviomagense]|uniref:ISL3 family transposase n=1 Tax=Mycobacterium noviomagense TaxID=459858 RepID=A0A7I7PEJ3_9MYCO|nr:ISL3 family transposase [Mycobacterium noviomagense]ORB14469.1 ISL3 family transposase [Mycobacterium noviomagense]BBY06919.1 ISL3 family transposase [Mycobacterium noviomagense]